MERERLQFSGRLREKELKANELRLKAQGLRESVRSYLDPFEKIEELDVEVAFQQMADLAETVLKYKEILAEIAAIKKALGK